MNLEKENTKTDAANCKILILIRYKFNLKKLNI